jgi:hypothetical protein
MGVLPPPPPRGIGRYTYTYYKSAILPILFKDLLQLVSTACLEPSV